MAMEFSECRFICSTSLRKLQEVHAEATRRKLDIEFVLVSLDPKNDTPAAWQKYRKARDLPHTNWTFLTGSRQATDRMVQALDVHWWYYDEHIMHDLKIVRLAPNGKIVGEMKTFDMTAAEFLDERPRK
jgi:protein SCO1/2